MAAEAERVSAFDTAFEYVVGREGGYSDDPHDRGGETKYGISKRQYPNVDIPRLTLDEARAIYLRDYWTPARCEELPPALALCMFDAAVNHGISAAVQCLQLAVGVNADGKLGPLTMLAVGQLSPSDLVEKFQAERILRYAGLPDWKRYGRGWARRAIRTAMEAT